MYSNLLFLVQEAAAHDEASGELVAANGHRKPRRLSQAETEKIQIAIENAMMRFPSKSIMEKIIEYVNFEASHKYTLVVSTSGASSRPVTRGKSHSPVGGARKQSVSHAPQTLLLRSDSKRSLNDMLEAGGGGAEAAAVDHVLTKVLTDDEAMIAELRNATRSRNSLRSKHMEQLEETKAELTDIKSRAAKTLIAVDADGDQEFPPDRPETSKALFYVRLLFGYAFRRSSISILSLSGL